MTSLVKNTIKAFAYHEETPASVIAKTNEIVRKQSAPGTFVTVIFAILDIKTGALIYCNGGHPHPVIKRKTGEAHFMDKSSPAIGILTEQKFLDEKQGLKKGDSLILYTDGITETRKGTELYGDERLLGFIKKQKEQPAKKLVDAIFKEVNGFSSGKLTDDIVLLTIGLN